MAPIDRLSPLFEQFRVRTRLFHTGPLCGTTTFATVPGRGFLHVLRSGEMEVTHDLRDADPAPRHVDEPTLLFYPRPIPMRFATHRLRTPTSPALRWTLPAVRHTRWCGRSRRSSCCP